jgi:hypothetical protein
MYLEVDNQQVDQVASNSGWFAFCLYVRTLLMGTPELLHLACWGWSDEPAACATELAVALEQEPPEDEFVAKTAQGLLELLRDNDGAEVVNVSDGMVEDDEEVERFDEFYHGPQPPDEGHWELAGVGPEGGKRWRRVHFEKEPSKGKEASPRSLAILEEADKIDVTDDQVGSEAVDDDDYDEIQNRMTSQQQREMDRELERIRDSSIDDMMSDYTPEVDERDVARSIGLDRDDIEERAAEIFEKHGLEKTPEVSRRMYGPDAIQEVIDSLDDLGEDSEPDDIDKLKNELEEWKNEAEEKLTTAMEEAEEYETDQERSACEHNYDDLEDRREYLRQFYNDNEDMFAGESGQPGVWCKDYDGDGVFNFNTDSGKSYKVSAVYRHGAGVGVPDMQFSDPSGSFQVTGGGEAFQVFAKVVPAMVAYIKKKGLDAATFSAAEPSRQRLYNRLVKEVAKVMPDYFAAYTNKGSGRYYVLGKASMKDEILQNVKGHIGAGNDIQLLAAEQEPVDGEWQMIEPESDPAWWTAEGWPALAVAHAEGDGRALADFYAKLWNGLLPKTVGHEEHQAVQDELAELGWSLEYVGRRWVPILLAEQFAEPEVPGDIYRGPRPPSFGKWEAAPTGPRGGKRWKRIDAPEGETSHERRRQTFKVKSDERRARGNVDVEALRKMIEPHGKHKLTAEEQTSAKASFRALVGHHKDLVVHRLEEIAGTLHKALGTVKDKGQKKQIGRRLKAVGLMLDMAKEKGHEGKVAPEGDVNRPLHDQPAVLAAAVDQALSKPAEPEKPKEPAEPAKKETPSQAQLVKEISKRVKEKGGLHIGELWDDFPDVPKKDIGEALLQAWREDRTLQPQGLSHGGDEWTQEEWDHDLPTFGGHGSQGGAKIWGIESGNATPEQQAKARQYRGTSVEVPSTYEPGTTELKFKPHDKNKKSPEKPLESPPPEPQPKLTPPQAAKIEKVNGRIDKYAAFFRQKNPEVAGWLDQLKAHVNEVGAQAALDALGEEKTGGDDSEVQYQGGWDSMSDFAEQYLARQGISLMMADPFDPETKILSSMSPSQGAFVRGNAGDFFPADPTLKNKLEEAKALPGLEKSEDINVVMGLPDKKVTHLTPDVTKKLDDQYGAGKWIVKAYGDDAAAGYGIFFPQRAQQIKQDAQNAIWQAGADVAKYGFKLRRDQTGKVTGLERQGGEVYDFGTDKYKNTIYGHAREAADRAASAAANEQGAELPGAGKDFMVQPAFAAVGVSEADRAAGRTLAPGEGRVHITTRNGRAEIIPHSTWIKGEHLPVVFENDDTLAMAKAAQDAINALPESERQGQIYAPDIIKTGDGYRVVEANPANETGTSGYLGDSQYIIDSFVSHMTGRTPAHVRFIQKLLKERTAK